MFLHHGIEAFRRFIADVLQPRDKADRVKGKNFALLWLVLLFRSLKDTRQWTTARRTAL
jgi:hypothetical protein